MQFSGTQASIGVDFGGAARAHIGILSPILDIRD